MLCLFWHDERSCTRFVETYHSLIMSDIFKGPLGRNFTCSEVFQVCASPYTRDTLKNYIQNKTAYFRTDQTKDNDFIDKQYTA